MNSSKNVVAGNIKNVVSNNINSMKQIIQSNNYLVNLLVILFILFLVVMLVFYIKQEISKKETNCDNIKSQYHGGNSITNYVINNDNKDFLLNEYYILSAHNCCCSGNNKNDYVDICALENCIKQGARFLDFQIYNKKNVPVVASSSQTSFKYKETYNYLDINDVFKTIINKAFSSGSSPNYNDPLFLYFRIYSNEQSIYDKLAESIDNKLAPKLLSSITYSSESNGINIFNKKMQNFLGKVIIIVNVDNQSAFNNSKLKQYTNITSGPNSPFIQMKTSFNINSTQNVNDLIKYNKMNSTIVIPDLNSVNINYDPSISLSSGCQFISMNFQNKDNYLTYLLDKFNNANSAFLLKPQNLRPIEIDTQAKEKIPENLNCEPKLRQQIIGTETIVYNA
ncbi:hypothetical protein CL656_07105 [bacterium]|nr:hypothetical protein [bacterium]|tara:strand:+ start:117 stop:1301 length:1185 start_codon:yes stop_codon:yes gene_type:complete